MSEQVSSEFVCFFHCSLQEFDFDRLNLCAVMIFVEGKKCCVRGPDVEL